MTTSPLNKRIFSTLHEQVYSPPKGVSTLENFQGWTLQVVGGPQMDHPIYMCAWFCSVTRRLYLKLIFYAKKWKKSNYIYQGYVKELQQFFRGCVWELLRWHYINKKWVYNTRLNAYSKIQKHGFTNWHCSQNKTRYLI